jgi:branched-chain amino acid transport system substrate-binding protein
MRAIRRRPLMGGLLGAVAAPAVARAQGQELRIGALFPFSGAPALIGDESFRGLEIAVEQRNAAGGVAGRPLRLVRAEAVEPAQAAAEARRLAAQERVAAVFGTAVSALCLAATQVTELQGVPYLELGATADAITERGFRHVFRTGPRSADLAALAAGAIEAALAPALGAAPRALRLAILHDEGLDGQMLAAALEAEFRARGLALAERLTHAAQGADLGALIQRLRAAHAEIVLHAAFQNDIAPFFRALEEAGWRPRMVIGAGPGYAMADTARAIGPAFEGALSLDVPPFALNERFAPGAAAFQEAYKRRYGAEPRSGHSLANHAGATVCLEAMHRAGGAERERLRAELLATDVPPGGTSAGWGVRFDEKGQNTRAEPVLAQWQQGRLLAVFPEAAAAAALRARLGTG